MAFVLDASVTMRWLTKDGTIADLAYANFILDKFLEPNMHVHVPSHWPLEITNVMLRSERRGLIDETASENFLDTLKLAPVMVDLATGVHAFDETHSQSHENIASPLTTRPISNLLCASPRHLPRSIKTFAVPPNRRVLPWRKKGRVSPAFNFNL